MDDKKKPVEKKIESSPKKVEKKVEEKKKPEEKKIESSPKKI